MMLIRRAALVLGCLSCFAAAAQAGDAAARAVIGFSPDGAHFAFEQYTTLYEDDAAFSEFVVIDTRNDRFVAGTPIRVLVRGDDGLDEKKARADAQSKTKPVLDRLKISEPGTKIDSKPSMELDEIGIYQMDTKPFAKALDLALPGGRKAALTVTDIPLGTATCSGFGGRGVAGKAKAAGAKVTLTIAGAAPIVLQNDTALPKNRRCAAAYGIAEAHLHTAADGTVTLAALIEYADNHDYHAGPNRRFMAVTKRLPKP